MAGKRFDRMKLDRQSESGDTATVEAVAPARALARDEVAGAAAEAGLARHPLGRLLRPRVAPASEIPEIGTPVRARPRDTIGRRALAVADMAAATAALLLGVAVIGDDRIAPALVAAIPLVVLVSKVIGLYDRDEQLVSKNTLEEAPALFQVATLFTLVIWLGEGAFLSEDMIPGRGGLGHTQVLGLWGLLFAGMLGARTAARGVVRRATPPERCLVLGGAEGAGRVDGKLRAALSTDALVVGRVPLEAGEGEGAGPAVLGSLDELEGLIRRHEVDRVIVAPTTADSEQLLFAIRLAKSLGVKVSVLPRLFEVVGSSVRFDDVEGLVLLGVPSWGLSKSSRMVKRSVDLVGAGLGLLVLAPLIVTIALTVKVTSRGPVFFRQVRVGSGGKDFEMLKFRTMYDGADEDKAELFDLNEADGLFKIANDPRLTDVGRVLRRFSFDELPQLLNVLRGDMSLVGPRPLVSDDDRRVEGWQRRRLEVSPGMTGIWQVLGSSRVPLHEMVKLDYLYAANWSLWLDVKILLRTVPHVAGRRGL